MSKMKAIDLAKRYRSYAAEQKPTAQICKDIALLSEAVLEALEALCCDWNYCNKLSQCNACQWFEKYSSEE